MRRALPDGSLGHAEVHDQPAPRDDDHQWPTTATTQDRVNDFVIKLANVNGTGSASANTLLMKSIFRMGVPVMGKNYFPSNIQGLPTWYEIRVTQGRLRRALRPRRPHGRDECRDVREGRRAK